MIWHHVWKHAYEKLGLPGNGLGGSQAKVVAMIHESNQHTNRELNSLLNDLLQSQLMILLLPF